MRLGIQHIGKEIQFSDGQERGIFLGRVPAYRDDMAATRVVLEEKNGRITVGHGCGDEEMGPGAWHLVEETPALPKSIEPLMKEFGCHEKQTRALVAAILKEVKER